MANLNYTFIIPHKNIPALLQRCLDSIPKREDIQIIVVDDNSDPDKVDLEHFPGLDESCVEVYFTKEGKGAGYARNIGLKYARGKWLLFADADDFFNYCLNDILNEYINDESDIVYFKSNSLDSEYYISNFNRGVLKNQFIDLWKNNPDLAAINLKYLPAEPWGKMIKRNIVETYHLGFDETSAANDTTFSYMTAFYAKNISVDMRAMYCVTYRYGSISTIYSKTKEEERLVVYAKRDMFYKKHHINPTNIGMNCYSILVNSLMHRPQSLRRLYGLLLNLGISNNTIIIALFREIFCRIIRKLEKWKKVIILL